MRFSPSPGESVRACSDGKTVGRWKQKYGDHIRWRDSPGSSHNRENPAIGYDHRITAFTFLPFSGVFPSETTAFPRVPAGCPWNQGPESLSCVYSFICQCNELFFFCNRKNSSLYWQINFPFYALNLHWSACWMAFYLLPNTVTWLVQTQNNILWKSFYTIHVCWHVLFTLSISDTTHLSSQQDPIFSAHPCL